MRTTATRVALLDADVELAERIPPAERAFARERLLVPTRQIARGAWIPERSASRPLAYVLLDGHLLRDCRLPGRWSAEILGPGDVLRPWDDVDEVVAHSQWHALELVRLGVLDQRLALAVARWPGVLDELLSRTVRRSRNLATLRNAATIRQLDMRLIVILRLLAERWGRVSPHGVHVGVRLTHETLARLASAQRPSVSSALRRLRANGSLTGRGRELVLAHGAPAAHVMARQDPAVRHTA